MPPPQLPGNAPVADIPHPLEILGAAIFRNHFDVAALDRGDRRPGRVHVVGVLVRTFGVIGDDDLRLVALDQPADPLHDTLAIVRLEEGVQMLTNIVGCDPDEVYSEMPVEVVFEPLNAEISLPKFKPASGDHLPDAG